jgi:hypothetical protein
MGAGRVTRDKIVKGLFVRAEAAFPLARHALIAALRDQFCRI